jgi:hypothetical protein
MKKGLQLEGLDLSKKATSTLGLVLGQSIKKVDKQLTSGNIEADNLVSLATGRTLASLVKRKDGEKIFEKGCNEESIKAVRDHINALSAKVNASTDKKYRLALCTQIVNELFELGFTNLNLQPAVGVRTASVKLGRDRAPNQKAMISLLESQNEALRKELQALKKG